MRPYSRADERTAGVHDLLDVVSPNSTLVAGKFDSPTSQAAALQADDRDPMGSANPLYRPVAPQASHAATTSMNSGVVLTSWSLPVAPPAPPLATLFSFPAAAVFLGQEVDDQDCDSYSQNYCDRVSVNHAFVLSCFACRIGGAAAASAGRGRRLRRGGSRSSCRASNATSRKPFEAHRAPLAG